MRAVLASLAAATTCAARNGGTVEARQTTAAPAASLASAIALVRCPFTLLISILDYQWPSYAINH
jgi:hypothetical protein